MSGTVRFGTDGIRGRASVYVTNDLAYRLGRAQMDKLFVYKGAEHPHVAQAPQAYDTSAIRRG